MLCGAGWKLKYRKSFYTDDVIKALMKLDPDAVDLMREEWGSYQQNLAKELIFAIARALNHKIVGIQEIN
jgi:hypothetical protein